MRRRLMLMVTAVLLTVVMVVAPASGSTTPQLRGERVYFHCAGTTKLGNASLLEGAIPSWNTTPPSASVTAGNGCGTLDLNAVAFVINPQENPTDGVWTGTFTGNLDRFTVTLYNLLAVGSSRVDGNAAVGVRLSIDGRPFTGDGTEAHPVTAVESNSGATQTYEFSVTGIGLIEPNADEDGDGIGDNPFGRIEHTITLTVDGYYADENLVGNWVYDTTEVPAGITFNPSGLADTVIPSQG